MANKSDVNMKCQCHKIQIAFCFANYDQNKKIHWELPNGFFY